MPVFADIDPRTLNLDPAAVEAAVTARTKAIVAVDIYGYPCELDELRAIARRARARARSRTRARRSAPGTRARSLGSHGPTAVFAFYPNKQITTGEGGIVTTHSEEEWRLLRSLRNQGRAGRWRLARARAARLQLPARRRQRGARDRRSSRSSTRSSRLRGEVADRYAEVLRDIDGVELPLRGRRRPCALVVRVRREGAEQRGARARDRRISRARGSASTAICRRSTCSRTCASGTGSARGCARCRRTRARARWRCRSTRRSSADAQERVAEALAASL